MQNCGQLRLCFYLLVTYTQSNAFLKRNSRQLLPILFLTLVKVHNYDPMGNTILFIKSARSTFVLESLLVEETGYTIDLYGFHKV